MADTSGMADLRGLHIQTLVTGFAEDENIFKSLCRMATTPAREIRWYQKTNGFLDSTDTTGITASQITGVAFGALPDVAEQSWTRNSSKVQKFMIDSPWIPQEDIKDSDVNILAANIRDLTRAVERQVDARIYSVATEAGSPSTIQTSVALGTGWDDTTNGNPVKDLLSGSMAIKTQGYDTDGLVVILNPADYVNLFDYVHRKGAQSPQFSNDRLQDATITKFMNMEVLISNNATSGTPLILSKGKSVSWQQFEAINAVTIEEKGIGTKIRIWETGEALLEHPKSVFLITGAS